MSRKCELTDKVAQFGNNVSHSQRKSRRSFKVNTVNVTLRSELLKKNFRLKVAASTVRTIDFKGGFDNFLLNTKSNKLSDYAVQLKRAVRKISSMEATAKKEKASA